MVQETKFYLYAPLGLSDQVSLSAVSVLAIPPSDVRFSQEALKPTVPWLAYKGCGACGPTQACSYLMPHQKYIAYQCTQCMNGRWWELINRGWRRPKRKHFSRIMRGSCIYVLQGVPSGRRLSSVDLDCDCSTVCPTVPQLVGIWQKWPGSWTKWWNI